MIRFQKDKCRKTQYLPKRKHMLVLELETLVSVPAAAYKVLLLPCPLQNSLTPSVKRVTGESDHRAWQHAVPEVSKPGRSATLGIYFRCGFSNPKDKRIKSGRVTSFTVPSWALSWWTDEYRSPGPPLGSWDKCSSRFQRQCWLAVHSGQHTSGPTVRSRGKAYLVKAVPTSASQGFALFCLT